MDDLGDLTSPIRPGAKPGELRVFDHGFVRLDAAMADDLSVVNSARVSFAVRKEQMEERDRGLIKFLMRERHGCYDDATEVLTGEGWKPWPQVTGEELFATRSPLGELEYQPALRVVHKEYRGHMIGFEGMSLDLLVTPDHRVLVSPITTPSPRRNPVFSLMPAHSVLWRSHRHTTTAHWSGEHFSVWCFGGLAVPAESLLRLVGFFIADGYFNIRSNRLAFEPATDRGTAFLRRVAAENGLTLRERGERPARRTLRFEIPILPEMRELFASCYQDKEKVIPPGLLGLSAPLLGALLEGLLESDGTREVRPGRGDGLTFYTTSRLLAGQVQELALKIGRSATVRPHRLVDGRRLNKKESWRVSIYNHRNLFPALCRTRAQAGNHMGVERYNGTIHCVEVPNSTLYVRRHGYPVFAANTPFEHNAFRFHIRCPIFVAREWFRHRIGSFNEESARYHTLKDDFYLPEPEAVRSQVGKPGAYSFEPTEAALAGETVETLRSIYQQAYEAYRSLVDKGVAKELARAVLPFGIFTQFYWTVNARSIMNFLSLRNSEFAQYEIRVYAQAVERLFAEKMAITYEGFLESGRQAP
ncbi:MAG: FAD-dependent thymidylate synthase [Actinomycetota bacterium]